MITHIYPTMDLKDHDIEHGGDCACVPKLEQVDGDMMWIHNSFDKRELLEEVTQVIEANRQVWNVTLN